MKLIEYYKKHLGEDVAEVHSLYFNPNTVPDDFPYYSETFNEICHQDGKKDYFLHPYEFGHTLSPLEFKEKWLKYAINVDNEDLEEDLEV